MTRTLAGLIAVLCMIGAAPQERPEYGQGKMPVCSMKKKEMGYFCGQCYQILEEKDIEDDKEKKKVKNCKKCKKEVKYVEVCIKIMYQCGLGYSTNPKKGYCKTAQCKKERRKLEASKDKARIVYRCYHSDGAACMNISDKSGKCKTKGCVRKGRALIKMCEKSGSPPHADKK